MRFLLYSLLLLLLLQLPTSSFSDNIPLGSTITPSNASSWSSANQTFSFAFTAHPSFPSLLLPAIAYSGGVPVWSPPSLPAVDSSSSLTLQSDGNLQLHNGSGVLIWQSSTAGKGVAAASIEESGNFRLTNSTSVVWQSFDHPADTLVESQNFTLGQLLQSGPYSFFLGNTGNLTLTWNRSVTYFTKGLNSSFVANKTLTSPSLFLQSDGIISLADASLPSSAVIAYSSDYAESGEFLRFLRLDKDGNFRAYTADKGTGVATDRWSAVADQCEVFGWCGNMGICSYNDTSPVCGCPSQNFELADPNNPNGGCKWKTEIKDCPGNTTMLELDHTLFLTYPPDILTEKFYVGITACKLNCLNNPSQGCAASTSLADGSGLCYLKVSNFVSGYQSSSLPSTSFVKVCSPPLPNIPPGAPGKSQKKSSDLSSGLVAAIVIGTVIGLMALQAGIWWCFCRDSPKFGSSSGQYALLEYASGAPVQFSYKELHRSTKGFKEKLGAGGFGAVYKGVLANRTVVAVKQLEGIEQGEKQFRMEVATISSTHHLNLARLVGFCSEGRHRLLVYEFMKNGSLDGFLFSDELGKLAWSTRFSIAIGTARGITYLHEECRDCIVHCDIKPENILLDEQFNAKVSDFGLAKLVNPKDHRNRTLTSIRGTRGYLPPEWLANLPISSKSDVYSYGMVLLEIISGRRNFDVSENTGRKRFSVWAYEEFQKGNIFRVIDKRLPEQEVDVEQLGRALQVSFWCIQEQPAQRPPMGKVVQMLEGIMEIGRPPAPKPSDVSLSATSGSVSVGAHSIFAASNPVQTSAVSFPATAGSSSFSHGNAERTSSSLIDKHSSSSI